MRLEKSHDYDRFHLTNSSKTAEILEKILGEKGKVTSSNWPQSPLCCCFLVLTPLLLPETSMNSLISSRQVRCVRSERVARTWSREWWRRAVSTMTNKRGSSRFFAPNRISRTRWAEAFRSPRSFSQRPVDSSVTHSHFLFFRLDHSPPCSKELRETITGRRPTIRDPRSATTVERNWTECRGTGTRVTVSPESPNHWILALFSLQSQGAPEVSRQHHRTVQMDERVQHPATPSIYQPREHNPTASVDGRQPSDAIEVRGLREAVWICQEAGGKPSDLWSLLIHSVPGLPMHLVWLLCAWRVHRQLGQSLQSRTFGSLSDLAAGAEGSQSERNGGVKGGSLRWVR